jgi:hypothetical protein
LLIAFKPELRRLRFPSFKFNFQRASTDSNASQSCKTGFRDNDGLNQVNPVKNRERYRESDALWAAKQRVPRDKDRINSMAPSLSTAICTPVLVFDNHGI